MENTKLPTPEEISRLMANWGRKGGKAQVAKGFAKMSPEKRVAAGRKGAATRKKRRAEGSAKKTS